MSLITNEKEFFRAIAKESGLQQKEIRKFYQAMIKVVTDSANSADETKTRLPNFAVLEVKNRDGRIARDPRNSNAIFTPATRQARLRLLPRLKEATSVESYKKTLK